MEGLLAGGTSHNSNITGIAEMFDPMSYITPDVIDPHTYSYGVTSALNEGLSPITSTANQIGDYITPGKKWLDDQVPLLRAWNDTTSYRPVDAAGIVASLYGGGVASGAVGGAGAAAGSATGGTLGAAGTAAGTSAITPAFATGVGATTGAGAGAGLGAAGSAYGSSMLGLGGTAAGSSAAATAAGGGIGGLGAAGTAYGTSALTPAFASTGGAVSQGSYMGQLYDKAKDLYGQGKEIKDYYDKGQQVYDLFNPDQQQQDLSQPQQLVNPYHASVDPLRFTRGY